MELIAPSHWRRLEFISDLHLQPQDAATFDAWRHYLQTSRADALFILGDLFEVWVGDDVLSDPQGFEAECARLLHATAQRMAIYIMCGNRDFLMGPACMRACGATALPDPSVLQWGDARLALSHGDALCLDDSQYQAFRRMVRGKEWQTQFLAQPLPERQNAARAIRQQSEALKRTTTTYADVDRAAALALLGELKASTLLHGHTHQPADHALAPGLQRVVLSDWAADAKPPRAEVWCWTMGPQGSLAQTRMPWVG